MTQHRSQLHEMDSKKSQNCTVFHESDYHTPRTGRRLRLLERKSAACMCTSCAVFFVLVVVLAVTVSLKFTGNRGSFDYQETLGDTRLIPFNPSYCQAIHLESRDTDANMYLLDDKPPLNGWSNITFDTSFVIKEYTEYEDNYGWYDYGDDDDYIVDIDYVTWNFHLNRGSEIYIDACHEGTQDDSATIVIIDGKSSYANWQQEIENLIGYQIPQCSTGNVLKVNRIVGTSNEYYFVFYSPTDSSPQVNASINLFRTEYTVNNNNNIPSCSIAMPTNSCQIKVPLGGQKYALIQIGDTESSKVKYGDKASLTWVCVSRSWVYLLIFAVPVLFFTLLFVSMYCIIMVFWNRKLKSYQTLGGNTGTSNDDTGNSGVYKIRYENPEKKSINLIT